MLLLKSGPVVSSFLDFCPRSLQQEENAEASAVLIWLSSTNLACWGAEY